MPREQLALIALLALAAAGVRAEGAPCAGTDDVTCTAEHADPVLAERADALRAATAQQLPPALALQRIAQAGVLEAAAAGAALGAGGAFMGTATALSAWRTSEAESLAPLLLMTAGGGAVGGGLFAAATAAWHPSAGTLALLETAPLWGAGAGFALQWAVFAGARSAAVVPLRFASVLGGAATFAAGAGAAAALVPVSGGQVGVANSVGLASAASLAFAGAAVHSAAPTVIVEQAAAFTAGAGAVASYVAALALHPLPDVDRQTAALIDVGTGAGALVGVACAGLSGGAPWGYGAGALSTLLGTGAGLLAVRIVPHAFAGLSTTSWSVALAPARMTGQAPLWQLTLRGTVPR